MTRGEHVGLVMVVFLATVGVGTWALVLPTAAAFALGVGWGLIVLDIISWAKARMP